MAHSGWHQSRLDKAHESTGTIRALQEASHKGAELHLKSQTVNGTAETPAEG